jgi:methylated-DNA-[protein]-cysteine S-methyltransferase
MVGQDSSVSGPQSRKLPQLTAVREVTTPLGDIRITASPDGVREVIWDGEQSSSLGNRDDGNREDKDEKAGVLHSQDARHSQDDKRRAEEIANNAVQEITEYFAGSRFDFNLPLDPQGTPFQQSVWQTLRTIPYGSTISYGGQARLLGDYRKARAVGAANGRNPIGIIVPCHRVIGSNGALTGFAAGVDKKQALLKHEQRFIPGRLSVRRKDDTPEIAEIFSRGLTGPDGEPLNIFGVLAHHPAMLKRWLVFATHVLSKSTLNARDREILILRTGWNCRSRYEWGQHVLIGRECGLSDLEIERIKGGPNQRSWSTTERLLLEAADELHSEQALSSSTWNGLAESYSIEQVLDVIATVGNYHLVAMFLKSARVPLDAGVPFEAELD